MVDTDPNREVHGHSSVSPAADRGGPAWLWWLLGLAALALILFFALRGCDRTDRTVATTTDTVTSNSMAAPATTATGEPATYSQQAFTTTLTGTEPLPVTYALDRVTFASGSAQLDANAQAQVDEIAAALKTHPNARVALRGYADPSGSEAANQALSEKRADAVRKGLINSGAKEGQIAASAQGETGTTATRANRRVEVTVLQR